MAIPYLRKVVIWHSVTNMIIYQNRRQLLPALMVLLEGEIYVHNYGIF